MPKVQNNTASCLPIPRTGKGREAAVNGSGSKPAADPTEDWHDEDMYLARLAEISTRENPTKQTSLPELLLKTGNEEGINMLIATEQKATPAAIPQTKQDLDELVNTLREIGAEQALEEIANIIWST